MTNLAQIVASLTFLLQVYKLLFAFIGNTLPILLTPPKRTPFSHHTGHLRHKLRTHTVTNQLCYTYALLYLTLCAHIKGTAAVPTLFHSTHNTVDSCIGVPNTQTPPSISTRTVPEGAQPPAPIQFQYPWTTHNTSDTFPSTGMPLNPYTLRLGTYNIRGGLPHKAAHILNIMDTHSLDILYLQETNMVERQILNIPELHKNTAYRSFWTRKHTIDSQNKSSGFGCGIIINSRLDQHIRKATRLGGNYIDLILRFPKHEIRLANTYWPAQRHDPQIITLINHIHTNLKKDTNQKRLTIYGGDWNAYTDGSLDHYPPLVNARPRTLLPLFAANDLVDIFRTFHPTLNAISHATITTTRTTGSRLDSFWSSLETATTCSRAAIDSEYGTTYSDHFPVLIELHLQNIVSIATHQHAATKRIPDFRNATNDDTLTYTHSLAQSNADYLLEIKTLIYNATQRRQIGKPELHFLPPINPNANAENPDTHHSFSTSNNITKPTSVEIQRLPTDGLRLQMMSKLDKITQSFTSTLWAAAMKTLPTRTINGQRKSVHENRLNTLTRHIGHTLRTITDHWSADSTQVQAPSIICAAAGVAIDFCRTHSLDENAPTHITIANESLATLRSTFRTWNNHIFILRKHESELQKAKSIQTAVEKRNDMYSTNLRQMLNNILDRKRNSIKITSANALSDCGQFVKETFFDPDAVKTQIHKDFSEWFKPRQFTNFAPDSVFHEIYEPMEDIDATWYEHLMDPPTRDEFNTALAKMGQHKAPGPSGIPIELWQHSGKDGLDVLFQLTTVCIQYGDVPDHLVQGIINPIPKSEDWNGDIRETRPISLLESAYKLIDTILTTRFLAIYDEHPHILRGNNFSGTKGSSVEEPLQIVQAIIEHAIANKEECYILYNDIKKAFDSQSVEAWCRGARRIKLPYTYCRFKLNTHRRLSSKIATSFGVTDPIYFGSMIIQGSVSGVLDWRICWDPLLTALQKHTAGYTLKTKKLQNPYFQHSQHHNLHVATTAFVDDTTLINKSEETLQSAADLIHEFQSAVGIESNGKKITAMCVSNTRRHLKRTITLGSHTVTIRNGNASDRYLGNYFQANGNGQAATTQIKQRVSALIATLMPKCITDKTTVYIINRILYTQLRHIWTTFHLSEALLKWIDTQTCNLLLKKCGLPRGTPKSILYHIYGLDNIRHTHINDQLTRYLNNASTPGHPQQLIALQTQALQAYIGSPTHPSDYSDVIALLPFTSALPTLGKLFRAAHHYNIHIEALRPTYADYKICHQGTPLIKLLRNNPHFPEIRPLLEHGEVWFLEQILTLDGKRLISFADLQRRHPFITTSALRSSFNILADCLKQAAYDSNIITSITPVTPNPFVEPEIQPARTPILQGTFVLSMTADRNYYLARVIKITTTLENANMAKLQHYVLLSTIQHKIPMDEPEWRAAVQQGADFYIHCDGHCGTERDPGPPNQCRWSEDTTSLTPATVTTNPYWRFETHRVSRHMQNPSTREIVLLHLTDDDLADIWANIESGEGSEHDPRSESTSPYSTVTPSPPSTPTPDKILDASVSSELTKAKRFLGGDTNTIHNLLTIPNPPNGHNIFTDASVKDQATPNISMSIALYLPSDNDNNSHRIKGCLTDATQVINSTKGESTGIILALLAARNNPHQSSVTLDNAASVAAANKFLRNQNVHPRHLLRNADSYLWALGQTIVQHYPNLQHLTVEWTKGHASNTNNIIADQLADEAHDAPTIHLCLQEQTLLPYWIRAGPIVIEGNVRKTLTRISKLHSYHAWLTQPLHTHIQLNRDYFDMALTLLCLHNGNPMGSLLTSTTDTHFRKFNVQSLHNLLPTQVEMHRRLPHIYHFDNGLCRLCGELEDQNHIWQCPAQEHTIEDILSNTKALLLQTCDSTKTYLADPTPWADALPELQFWRDNPHYLNFAKGMIPTSWETFLQDQFTTNESCRTALFGIVHHFRVRLHHELWLPRCDATIAWEKTVGITRHDKTKGRRQQSDATPPTTLIPQLQLHSARRRKTPNPPLCTSCNSHHYPIAMAHTRHYENQQAAIHDWSNHASDTRRIEPGVLPLPAKMLDFALKAFQRHKNENPTCRHLQAPTRSTIRATTNATGTPTSTPILSQTTHGHTTTDSVHPHSQQDTIQTLRNLYSYEPHREYKPESDTNRSDTSDSGDSTPTDEPPTQRPCTQHPRANRQTKLSNFFLPTARAPRARSPSEDCGQTTPHGRPPDSPSALTAGTTGSSESEDIPLTRKKRRKPDPATVP